jgi:hypothetical protein
LKMRKMALADCSGVGDGGMPTLLICETTICHALTD